MSEEGLFEILSKVAEAHGWELSRRDPGPDDEFWADEECLNPDCSCHRESDEELVLRAFNVIDLRP